MSSRRNKRGGGGEGGGEERWLLPYSDMITLLLGLFIVLFALSSVDAKKFDGVSAALSKTFKGQIVHNPGAIAPGSNSILNAKTAADSEFASQRTQAASVTLSTFTKEQGKLQKVAEQAQKQLGGKVNVKTDARGIVVSIAGDTLFASGSDHINPSSMAALVTIARNLATFGHPIQVEGYTDGQPIRPGEFDSNFDLSGNRASKVGDLMVSAGFPTDLLSTVGMGANQPVKVPKRVTDNVPENRRVEIHILAPGANDAGMTDSNGAPLPDPAIAAAARPSMVPRVQIVPPKLAAPTPSDSGLTAPVVAVSQ